jgi:hypothetical protein
MGIEIGPGIQIGPGIVFNNVTVPTVPTVFGQSYGGGYYAGQIKQNNITYYLIVAPKATGQTNMQVKTSATASPSATITLNNGPAASASMNSAEYPAAQFCEGLSIDGFTDWYMPARDELELCYRNLKPRANNNVPDVREKSSYTYPEGNDVAGNGIGVNLNSVPQGAAYTTTNPAQTSAVIFQEGNSEAFEISNYWSSSEFSSTDNWRQSFVNGYQFNSVKNGSWFVRAVRRVPV